MSKTNKPTDYYDFDPVDADLVKFERKQRKKRDKQRQRLLLYNYEQDDLEFFKPPKRK